MKLGQYESIESVKPLPKQGKELKEKLLAPKGVTTKGRWERKTFRGAFQKAA